MPLDGGTPRQLTSGAGDTAPSFSRDGKRLAFERSGPGGKELHELPSEGGEPTRLVAAGRVPVFSPTRDELVYLADGNTPTLMNLATRKTRPLAREPLFTGILAFSPDGTRVSVLNASAFVEVDLAEGRVVRRYDPMNDSLAGAAYVGDEIVVARQVWEGDIWLADGPFR